MPRYLLTMSAAQAAKLEAMLGSAVVITPAVAGDVPGHAQGPPGRWPPRAVVAGLDGITDEEYEVIARRLRTSGPLYHAGGPPGTREAAGKTRYHITLCIVPDPAGNTEVPVVDEEFDSNEPLGDVMEAAERLRYPAAGPGRLDDDDAAEIAIANLNIAGLLERVTLLEDMHGASDSGWGEMGHAPRPGQEKLT